jgi:hypothetical protein
MRNKLCSALLASCSMFAGCGSIQDETGTEVFERMSNALSHCSTTCSNGSNISCVATTCSAVEGAYINCDGVYQYCPASTSNCHELAIESAISHNEACQSGQQQAHAFCESRGGLARRPFPTCRIDGVTWPDSSYLITVYFCCNG